MASEVVMKFKVEEADAVRAYMKLIDVQSKAERGAKRFGNASARAGQKTQKAFQRGARDVMSFVGAVAGITTAGGGLLLLAAQLRNELEHLKRQASEAAQTQLTTGQARGLSLYNAPKGFVKPRLETFVAQQSKKHGVSQEAIWTGISGPLSATGGLSQKVFQAATSQAVRAHAISGADIGEIAGGGMDITRVTGGSIPQSLGWLRQIGQQLRVTELDKQIRTIVPIISASKQFGFSPEQGGELAAYLTQYVSDVTGKRSSTATIRFMDVLQGAMTKSGALIPEKVPGGFGKPDKIVYRPLENRGMAGLTEMQDWYGGADEELRREFAQKMPGRAKTKGALLALIARDPKALAAFGAAQNAISSPTAKGIEANWEGWFKDVAASPNEPLRTATRTLDTFTSNQQLTNPQAMAGVMRDNMRRALASIPGVSDLGVKMGGMKFELQSNFGRGDVVEAGIERIEDIEDRFGYGRQFRKITWANDGHGQQVEYLGELPEDRSSPWGSTVSFDKNPNYNPAQAEAFTGLLSTMNALLEEIRRGNAGPTEVVVVGGDAAGGLDSQVLD